MRKTLLQAFRTSASTLMALAFVLAPFGVSVPIAFAATAPTTLPATSITASDATLNGMNGDTAATESSFWASTSTFSTTPTSPLPEGVYSTPLLGAVDADAQYSAQLSSIAGLLPIMSGTTYYFVAWTQVDGTWSPGAVESFTTVSAPTIASVNPSSGGTAGGTEITITGTQFASGATVTVGAVPATEIVVVDETSITATTPPGTPGAKDVVVMNPDGATATATDGFTYIASSSASPTTLPATAITSSDATLNGLNGDTDASDASFWVSTSTFSTATPSLPDGVYSTPLLGAQAADAPYSAQLSSVSGLLPITSTTTYYFVAWTQVDGTWSPGEILQFTTSGGAGSGSIGGTVTGSGELAVTSVDAVDTTGTADGTFANGWSYVFNITLPTDESDVAMKFSDWVSGVNVMPTAGNMRISSAQADNGGATILVTAADVYTTPDLHMITDLDPVAAGTQVQVTVEVAIPVGTTNGSYSTNYGVRSQ